MGSAALTDVWPAPAKLNRFLRIVGRRPDGYHLLQTVFQFLDRCDYLSFEVRSDGELVREGQVADVRAEDDLTVRAARALQQATGVTLGATIRVEKRLPMGGGLGGGSSDAATTLVALNHYWRTGLTQDRLTDLGLRLGADVPVFVAGQAAWAEGVGERLRPVNPDRPWFVVVVPAVTVSTREVFSDPGLTRDSPPLKIRDFVVGHGTNDCESVVFRRYPQVAEAAAWLANYGSAQLTGTGGCVFAPFEDKGVAERIVSMLPHELSGFVARGLNRSPLLERLVDAQKSCADTPG